MDKIKILTITDSPKPKVTTGFANVARPIIQGFHEHGFEVYSFGTMDIEPDINRELPYVFQPANPFDEAGHRTVSLFLVNVQPDVIFILYDPGNVSAFVNIIISLQESGNLKPCPIVVYIPIEGIPIPLHTVKLIEKVQKYNGQVVVYSPRMIELLQYQYPQVTDLEYVYHGLDHADFRPYDEAKRKKLRQLVGWDDYFVVGSVGVNKRTKGFDNFIYTARFLRDIGQDDGIKFYLHTSPDRPVMMGYNLIDISENFGVRDMFIFKPEPSGPAGQYANGISHQGNLRYQPQDDSPEEYEKALASLGFVDRLNMLDCYLDLSQLEGWGLPAHEAMKCGIPTISVKDKTIREEIYRDGVLFLEPEPFRMWTTMHTGVKLVLVDPAVAAEAIVEMKNADPAIRKFWSEQALKNSARWKWAEAKQKFINIVNKVVDNYDYDVEMSSLPD